MSPTRRRFWRITCGFAIAWFTLCAIGAIVSRNYPREFRSCAERPSGPVVQLRACSIPYFRVIAVHLFLAAYDPETQRWQRWEVWQNPSAGGTSWGHVHRDLMHPDSDTGGGPVEIYHEWHGEEAERLLRILRRSDQYPDTALYRYWPGPNSNTYPVWVLREAGLSCELPPKAIGKDYLGFVGAASTPGSDGVQIETPLLGAKLGLGDGFELHVLCLTFGIDFWLPAIKTPMGRFGFDE